MIHRLVVCFTSALLLMGGCATQNQNEPRACPVHQISMPSELVVLRNGVSTWEYQEAREKYFPYSGTVYTGNALPGTQQQIAQADICPECRKTEMKWFQGELNAPEPEAAKDGEAVQEKNGKDKTPPPPSDLREGQSPQ